MTSTTTSTTTEPSTVVSSMSFTDLDPAAYELNGTVTWVPPADTSQYLHFGVWLLTRKEYSSSVFEVLLTGSQVNDPTTPEGNVPLGTNQLAFAETRDLGSNGYAQYLAVIPNRMDNDYVAAYSEAGFLSIVDSPLMSLGALEVQSVSFSDEDSVATYVKGTVTWTRQDNVDYGFVEASWGFNQLRTVPPTGGRERESAKFQYTIQTVRATQMRSILNPIHSHTVCFLCATRQFVQSGLGQS